MNSLSEENIFTTEKKAHSKIKDIVIFFIIVLGISWFTNKFLFFKAYIPTGSMKPAIMEGDEVFVNKFFLSVKRGDIIVFSHESSEELLIKRVIGLPGEKIEIKNGYVYANGNLIDEPYVKNNEILNKTFNVPEGHYLFFGDNRARSEDARKWENPYVSKENLEGKALFTIYPHERIGILE